jgi:hypothetical protein
MKYIYVVCSPSEPSGSDCVGESHQLTQGTRIQSMREVLMSSTYSFLSHDKLKPELQLNTASARWMYGMQSQSSISCLIQRDMGGSLKIHKAMAEA